jgi:hypothetical protein
MKYTEKFGKDTYVTYEKKELFTKASDIIVIPLMTGVLTIIIGLLFIGFCSLF